MGRREKDRHLDSSCKKTGPLPKKDSTVLMTTKPGGDGPRPLSGGKEKKRIVVPRGIVSSSH